LAKCHTAKNAKDTARARRERISSRRRVAVFFYGSFMDRGVLRQRGFEPGDLEAAKLRGFDIRFAPLATLVPADEHTCVYGVVATATHDELQRLYSEGMVSSYRPEPVVVETIPGRKLAALVYIARGKTPPPASDDYIQHLLGPAREFAYPDWYLEHLESQWRARESDPTPA
jgi:hypothetical protein